MKTLPLKAWMPGPWELLIVFAIVLVIFGPGKLSTIGKSMGGAIRDFKDSVKGDDDKEEAKAETTTEKPNEAE